MRKISCVLTLTALFGFVIPSFAIELTKYQDDVRPVDKSFLKNDVYLVAQLGDKYLIKTSAYGGYAILDSRFEPKELDAPKELKKHYVSYRGKIGDQVVLKFIKKKSVVYALFDNELNCLKQAADWHEFGDVDTTYLAQDNSTFWPNRFNQEKAGKKSRNVTQTCVDFLKKDGVKYEINFSRKYNISNENEVEILNPSSVKLKITGANNATEEIDFGVIDENNFQSPVALLTCDGTKATVAGYVHPIGEVNKSAGLALGTLPVHSGFFTAELDLKNKKIVSYNIQEMPKCIWVNGFIRKYQMGDASVLYSGDNRFVNHVLYVKNDLSVAKLYDSTPYDSNDYSKFWAKTSTYPVRNIIFLGYDETSGNFNFLVHDMKTLGNLNSSLKGEHVKQPVDPFILVVSDKECFRQDLHLPKARLCMMWNNTTLLIEEQKPQNNGGGGGLIGSIVAIVNTSVQLSNEAKAKKLVSTNYSILVNSPKELTLYAMFSQENEHVAMIRNISIAENPSQLAAEDAMKSMQEEEEETYDAEGSESAETE